MFSAVASHNRSTFCAPKRGIIIAGVAILGLFIIIHIGNSSLPLHTSPATAISEPLKVKVSEYLPVVSSAAAPSEEIKVSINSSAELKKSNSVPEKIFLLSRERSRRGIELVLDRNILWNTNVYETISRAKPRLAGRKGQILGITFDKIPKHGLLSQIGIRKNDIIKSINGIPLTRIDTLPAALIEGLGGNETVLEIDRNGKKIMLGMTSEMDPEFKPSRSEEKAMVKLHDQMVESGETIADIATSIAKDKSMTSSTRRTVLSEAIGQILSASSEIETAHREQEL